MPHLSLIDLNSRVGSVAEKKKHWIKSATKNSHGQFRAKAEAAGETTRKFAREKEDAPGKLGKEARLAEALMGASGAKKRRGSVLYDHKRK